MNSKVDVDDFLAQKKWAVVGVSRKRSKSGNMIYRELKKKGYHVFAVNPKADTIENDPCYKDLKSLPEKVDGAVLIVPPQITEKAVKVAAEVGISRIWMQQGTQSDEAINFCKENNITVIANECVLMFAKPVGGIHKLHRWLWKLFGKLPK